VGERSLDPSVLTPVLLGRVVTQWCPLVAGKFGLGFQGPVARFQPVELGLLSDLGRIFLPLLPVSRVGESALSS
jgi:hypothetical protein